MAVGVIDVLKFVFFVLQFPLIFSFITPVDWLLFFAGGLTRKSVYCVLRQHAHIVQATLCMS